MPAGGDLYQFGPFRLDPEAGILYRGAEPTMLGQRAVALLHRLLESAGAPVSKDALIEAYLQRRYDDRNERVRQGIAKHDDPRSKVLAVFDVADAAIARPTYRGCAFINASAEGLPGSVEESVSANARGWLRELFTDLAKQAGVKDAKVLQPYVVNSAMSDYFNQQLALAIKGQISSHDALSKAQDKMNQLLEQAQ